MQPFLLCTDMDRTLIPNGSEPESEGALPMLIDLAAQPEATIAYVTGRHRGLIEEAIGAYGLPMPDYAIADVGSTIYEVKQGGWRQWEAWSEEIDADWQGMPSSALHRMLVGIPGMTMQEAEKQNRHKLSYYVPIEANGRLLGEVKARLQNGGVRANLIWSIDEVMDIGLLDILPASANKRHAIEFLMQMHGFELDNTVFAGDSGNDLDVMLSPIQAVLVANASDEVRAAAAEAPMQASLYLAEGGYLGMNGNYSASILEGLAHFLPEVDAWLRERCGR